MAWLHEMTDWGVSGRQLLASPSSFGRVLALSLRRPEKISKSRSRLPWSAESPCAPFRGGSLACRQARRLASAPRQLRQAVLLLSFGGSVVPRTAQPERAPLTVPVGRQVEETRQPV